MRQARRVATLLLPVVVAVAGLEVAPAEAAPPPLPGRRVACNTSQRGSFRLLNNLNCTTFPFQIREEIANPGAPVVVDLNGHTVMGNGTAQGITTSGTDGNNVTIRNGVVSGFAAANLVLNGDNNRVENMVLIGAQTGASLSGEGTVVEDSIITGATFDGVKIGPGGDDAVIRNNTIAANPSAVTIDQPSGIRVEDNEIMGSAIGVRIENAPVGAPNVITANRIIGSASTSIFVTANPGGATITSNTIRGSGSRGIWVLNSPATAVIGNDVSGANNDGIQISGTSSGSAVENNLVAGNFEDGIKVEVDGVSIAGNTALENGNRGIFASAIDTVDNNIANFNGFRSGVAANDDAGIDAATSTGSGNEAAGNDLDAQCVGATVGCTAGSATPPPLTACGVVNESVALRNPLDCIGHAMIVSEPGVKLELGHHRVRAGSDPGEAGILVLPGNDGVKIGGGVIAGSNEGIRSEADKVKVKDVVVSDTDSFGIHLPAVEKVKIEKSFVVGTGAVPAVKLEDTQKTKVSGNVVTGSLGDGIELVNSSSNQVTKNRIVGNDLTGITITGSANSAKSNSVIGHGGSGIAVAASIETKLTKNTIVGQGTSAVVGHGIAITDSSETSATKNVVRGSSGSGALVGGTTELTTLTGNTFSANHVNGIEVEVVTAGTTVKGNVLDENGLNGSLSGTTSVQVDGNEANLNGFLNDATVAGNDVGLGYDCPNGTPGSGNDATDNDNPLEGVPASLLA